MDRADSVGTRRKLVFFGRERELRELLGLLDAEQRLITVFAPGGYGKSRLVSELLDRLANRFPGGVHEVRLAPVGDPGRIARATAEALKRELYRNDDVLVQLTDFLREKQLLLHFDNFEHLVAGGGILCELLAAAPGLRIIVTSREVLGLPGEHVYRLAALPVTRNGQANLIPTLSTAANLFTHRAQLATSTFSVDETNQDAVEAICRELEGVPLALELTAAWLDTYDLARIGHELREQLDIAARTSDVPERHRSVRASCDWSYALLSEYQQLVLRCIAVFKGGFSVEQAAMVLPEPGLETALRVLASKSWVYVDSTPWGIRYQMHDAAIREYAFQRLLNSADFEVAVRAHCNLFAGLLSAHCAKLHGAEQLTALQVLNCEIENILEAMDTALHHQNLDWVLVFAVNLQQYLLMVGSAGECLALYQELEEFCTPLQQPQLCQSTQLGLAAAGLQLGNYAEARGNATRALTAADKLQDHRGMARAEAILGEVDKLEGDHPAARRHYTNSLQLMQDATDLAGVARALHGLGRIEMTEGNFTKARKLVGDSLEIRRQQGDQFGAAQCLNDVGNMAYREGAYAEAFRMQTASLEIRRSLGDRNGIAQSLNNLGNVEFWRCDYPSAWNLYSESLAIRRDIGNRFGIAASLNNLGNVEYCQGNLDDARRIHQQGLALKREIGDRIGLSYSLNNLGNVATKQERYEEAVQSLREAIEIAQEVNSKECILAPLAVASCLLARLGQYRVAGMLAQGAEAQQAETHLALDPMDGGMLLEAQAIIRAALSVDEQTELKTTAGELDLDQLAALAAGELRHWQAGGPAQDPAATPP